MAASSEPTMKLARQLTRRLAWLAILSTLLSAGLALGAARAYLPAWRAVQVEYNERAEAAGLPVTYLGLRQIWRPELGITDRCTTCHLGMADAKPLPDGGALYGEHPPVYHQVGEMGCTLCHRGQGRATSVDAAHGTVSHWEEPMFPAGFAEAGCGPCHAEGARIGSPELVAEGRYFFELHGCSACHTRDGTGQSVGPDLGAIALKGLDHDWQVAHLRAPTSVVQGSRMMSFGHLQDHDVEALVAYLDSLIGAPKLMRGKELAARLGCRGCHRINGVGGDQGPVLAEAVAVPTADRDFSNVEGTTLLDWQRAHLRAPAKVSNGSKMPGFQLSTEDEDALLTYVLSLPGPDLPMEALPRQTLEVRVSQEREFGTEGGDLYQAFCAACHLTDAPNPLSAMGLTVPFIFNSDLLTVASDAYLRGTLAIGRPGREMPAWSTKEGGLRPAEVGTLVAFLRAGVPAPPDADAVAAAIPDRRVGASLFAGNCAGCHGLDAEGTAVAPSLANEEFLYLATSDFLYRTITAGRPDSGMPSHPQFDAGELASLIDWIRRSAPDELRRERMRVAFQSVTGVRDPFDYQAAGSATYGAFLFEGMCVACHGEAGRGGIGPGIGSPEFLGTVDDGFIAGTIALGRGGRAMRSFGVGGMSSLTDRELGDIITYLRSASAASGRPRGPELQGDEDRGGELFGSYCVGCHGLGGAGASGPSLANHGFLSVATDGLLLATIARGRSSTAMKGWLSGSNSLQDLPPEDVLDLVAYVRSFDSP